MNKVSSIVFLLLCSAIMFAGCDGNDSSTSTNILSANNSKGATLEFRNYNYEEIIASYPEIRECTESDYDQTSVEETINKSIESGDLAKALPSSGHFSDADKEALYREYMLPCKPDLDNYVPDNVKTIKGVLTKEIWDEFASNTAAGDRTRFTYTNSDGEEVPWPMQDDFIDKSYDNLLTAAARYPYFCGEKGFYDNVQEACKREIASFLAHAAQETGNGEVDQSFYWLREYGYVNAVDEDQEISFSESSFFDQGCAAPFDCKHDFQRYYGRGPKQITYYYNYAGMSASYFAGDYQYLLNWPDMVAYDGILYYSAAIWFVMTHQPPKPSIHDVILGRYRPENCTEANPCYGIIYDSETGIKHNFNVTIEIVNGGVECRSYEKDGEQIIKNQKQSYNRTKAYTAALNMLKAELTDDEKALAQGCDFIAVVCPDGTAGIFGVEPNLNKRLSTWLDMSSTDCKAQSWGGGVMISVTATGIIDACLKKE